MIRGLNMITAALVQLVDIKGRKTHKTIDDALQIVEHLEHRAGKDAEGKTGDGVGILLQIGHKFFKKLPKKPALRWATSVTTALACSFPTGRVEPQPGQKAV